VVLNVMDSGSATEELALVSSVLRPCSAGAHSETGGIGERYLAQGTGAVTDRPEAASEAEEVLGDAGARSGMSFRDLMDSYNGIVEVMRPVTDEDLQKRMQRFKISDQVGHDNAPLPGAIPKEDIARMRAAEEKRQRKMTKNKNPLA
jgi:hypothetical protein